MIAWVVALGLLGSLACVRPETDAEARCPPCECACEEARGQGAAPQAVTSPVAAPVAASAGDGSVDDLVASATRKMNFEDGAGCLADLEQVAARDPKLDARLAVTRGMCEMLVGRCQDGKRRIARWYQEETNMHPERAAATAESIAATRCRGGDSTERDRLLRAYYELSDGAFMNKKRPKECQAALAEARALAPKVQSQGPDDAQVRGGAQALFHTAAACLGRAGDCGAAYAVFRELFPDQGAIQDATTRERVIREAFQGMILHCAATSSGDG